MDGGANAAGKLVYRPPKGAPKSFCEDARQSRPLPEGERAAAAVRLQFRLGTVMLEAG